MPLAASFEATWSLPLTSLIQPAATILAASLVLVGVVLTLRHNTRQLIRSQLRTGAAERHRALQTEYCNLIGACFDWIANAGEVSSWAAYENDIRAGRLSMPSSQHNSEIEQTLETIAMLLRQRSGIRATAAAAQAKLLLIDDDCHRQADVQVLLDRLRQSGIADEQVRNTLGEDLKSFMKTLSSQLEHRLQDELRRANDCLPPVRVAR